MAFRSPSRSFCPNCEARYAPQARACHRCGRVRDQKTVAEMVEEARVLQDYLGWFWAIAGCAFVLILIVWIVKSRPVQKQTPVLVASPPTAEERAHAARQKAADAKFWAAKEKREAAEVESYHVTQDAASTAAAGTAATANQDTPIENNPVVSGSVDIPMAPRAPRRSTEEQHSHSTGSSQGSRAVSL